MAEIVAKTLTETLKAEIGADRMAMGLRCIPDNVRGDMVEVARMRAYCLRMERVLKEYADPKNWGYYDDSGCRKGIGTIKEACFIGPEPARKLLDDLTKA